jgi:uncharacterized protein with ParB-like and HNH nuclease domain
MTDAIRQFSIKALLMDETPYEIPMYQRNYAWGEEEITQLIRDVIDYVSSDHHYYIGTMVVAVRNSRGREYFEIIDGQQRFTTLTLLATYLKREGKLPWFSEPRLRFESRPNSSKTLTTLFKSGLTPKASQAADTSDLNMALLKGYRLISQELPKLVAEASITLTDFASFLAEKVQVIRTRVPDKIDLNRYFEIMNSRGEQLEMHEILKSRLLHEIDKISDPAECDVSKRCLSAIWDACSNMDQYV